MTKSSFRSLVQPFTVESKPCTGTEHSSAAPVFSPASIKAGAPSIAANNFKLKMWQMEIVREVFTRMSFAAGARTQGARRDWADLLLTAFGRIFDQQIDGDVAK